MVSAGEVIRASDVAVQACRVTHTTTQSIPNGSAGTVVSFNDESFDTDAMHSTVTNNSRITINTAGIYTVGFSGSLAAAADYTRTFSVVRINGTTDITRQQNNVGTATSLTQFLDVNTVHQFVAGDYIEVLVGQSNGAAASRNLESTADRSPVFYAARIGS